MPVPALDPSQRGAVLLLYDVTELARLDELRSELVAVASHELQTPLTTLRMTLLMLQEGASALPDRHRELVATSLIGVEQLSETVHEFLDLTRIEAGELRLGLEPVPIAALLADALRRIEGRAESQNVCVRAITDAALPLISADSVRLRAVFDNILSNALKYTPAGGTITVHARVLAPVNDPVPDTIAVEICDSGPGIPAAFRSRVFEKFFRLEHHQDDSRSGARGAGLGLYMCRHIVELHGGEIECDAGPGDRGTCIRVTLPARSAAPEAGAELGAYASS